MKTLHLRTSNMIGANYAENSPKGVLQLNWSVGYRKERQEKTCWISDSAEESAQGARTEDTHALVAHQHRAQRARRSGQLGGQIAQHANRCEILTEWHVQL